MTPSPKGRHRARKSFIRLVVAPAALVTAAVVAAGAVQAPAQPSQAASAANPMMFGASGSTRTLIEQNERYMGHRVPGARVYKHWDSNLITSSQIWARDTGHTLFMSIDATKNGRHIQFRDIGNAQPGSTLHNDMVRQAKQIKSFGSTVYLAFNHEPESWESTASGGPADFVSAWKKIHSVYKSVGVTNVKWTWVMTAYGFKRTDSKRAELYYPGDAYVDHIGADGYNWYRCRDANGGWVPLSNIIEGHRQFGLKHPTKGLMLWEWGSAEDKAQPGRKAAWFREATELFKKPAYSQYKAVITWEGRNYSGGGSCFDYLTSTSATQAWREMGSDPAFVATRVG